MSGENGRVLLSPTRGRRIGISNSSTSHSSGKANEEEIDDGQSASEISQFPASALASLSVSTLNRVTSTVESLLSLSTYQSCAPYQSAETHVPVKSNPYPLPPKLPPSSATLNYFEQGSHNQEVSAEPRTKTPSPIFGFVNSQTQTPRTGTNLDRNSQEVYGPSPGNTSPDPDNSYPNPSARHLRKRRYPWQPYFDPETEVLLFPKSLRLR